MATKYVEYCSHFFLPCSYASSKNIIICLQDAALVQGGLVSYISGEICQAYKTQDGCQNPVWHYTFSYSDLQLEVPETPLASSDITGVFCEDCLTSWVTQQQSTNAWLTLGNTGTVEGTNFLGTTDFANLEFRVNNTRAFKIFPDTGLAPRIIGGNQSNSAPNDGDTICGGGKPLFLNTISLGDGFNFIGGGYANLLATSTTGVIAGGSSNQIETCINSAILGGDQNVCSTSDWSVIGGGFQNGVSSTSSYSFLGGGYQCGVSLSTYGVVTGGNQNSVILGSTGFVGGGNGNQVLYGGACTIVAGDGNIIQQTGTQQAGRLGYGFIGGGQTNIIQTAGIQTDHSSIVGGELNTIQSEDWSSILGGWHNLIYDATGTTQHTGNAIVGGFGNTIKNGTGSTILGGASLQLGANSVGYQSPAPLTPPYFPTQVDFFAFPESAFFGDVDLHIGNTSNTARKLVLWCPNTDLDYSSGNYTTIESQAQNLSLNIRMVLPDRIGAIGDVLTINNQVGQDLFLSWNTPANTSNVLGRQTLDINSAATQSITITSGNYYITDIIFSSASVNVANAKVGIFADVGLVTLLTAVNNFSLAPLAVALDVLSLYQGSGNLNATNTEGKRRTETTLYASMQTLEGSPGTVEVIILGFRLG